MKYNPNPPIYVDETYPELVRFFENKEDAHLKVVNSNKNVVSVSNFENAYKYEASSVASDEELERSDKSKPGTKFFSLST